MGPSLVFVLGYVSAAPLLVGGRLLGGRLFRGSLLGGRLLGSSLLCRRRLLRRARLGRSLAAAGGLLLLGRAVHVHADAPRAARRVDHHDGGTALGAGLTRRLELTARRQRIAHAAVIVVGAADKALPRSWKRFLWQDSR